MEVLKKQNKTDIFCGFFSQTPATKPPPAKQTKKESKKESKEMSLLDLDDCK